jgi:hypothetical protein
MGGLVYFPFLVRDEYRVILDLVLSRTTAVIKTPILITGTSGIGKSIGGLHLVMSLVKKNHLVLYQYKNEPRVLFVADPEAMRKVGVPKTGVYIVEGEALRDALHIPGLVRIWDPADKEVVDTSGSPCLSIILSSPGKQELNDVNKLCDTFYMKLWTLPEVKIAMAQGGLVRHGAVVKSLTELEVEEGFEKYGGAIRPQVFAEFDAKLKSAISNTTFSDLSDYFNSPEGSRPKSELASLLVHRVPESDEQRAVFKVVIASNYIGGLLVQRFIESSRLELVRLCRSSQGLSGWGSLRGIVFEQIAHEHVMAGGRFKLLHVGTFQHPVIATEIEVEFPRMTCRPFHARLSELNPPLRMFDYAKPESKTYTALDAICCSGVTLPGTYHSPVSLDGFQFSVSLDHGFKRNGMELTRTDAVPTGAVPADLRAIYVTCSNASKPQTIIYPETQPQVADEYEYQQFVLRLNIFGEEEKPLSSDVERMNELWQRTGEELKHKLANVGLSTQGIKKDLVKRLFDAGY